MMIRLPIIFLLVLRVMASDPVDSTRLPSGGTWEGICGVSNGIPNRSTVFTNFGTSATMAQINLAIAACPSNQIVMLTNGTFSSLGSTDLTLNKSGVTVRGATNASGVPTTVLVFASGNNAEVSVTSWDYDNPAAFTTININSGATRGSSAVVVASTPTALTNGTLLFITAPGDSPTIEKHTGDYANWFPSTTQHPFTQIVKVTSVSGTTINFWPPINSDYISGLSCQVHYRGFNNQLVMSGLENLVITNTTGFFTCSIVGVDGADECWFQNCYLYGVGQNCQPNAGISFYTSFGCEIRHCQVAFAAAYSSSEYGMVTFQSGNLLVEDNVWYNLPNIWPMIATSGSAFAYNYIYWEEYDSPTFLSQIVFHHGAHNHYNLFEGNWIPSHFNDITSSGNFSHSRNSVYLRERLRGWDEYPGGAGKEVNCNAITFQNHHDNAVVVGCVMGTAGKQTGGYDFTNTGFTGGEAIYNADTTTRATLFRKHNYNTVDSGIRAGEALAGGEAIVNSYLHSSKPAWFGDRTWPWVDPVATSTSLASTTFTNFPAGYRFTFAADPPAGGGAGNPSTRQGNQVVRRGIGAGGPVVRR
jgi:hypothetical protein